ncbi:class B sortase [Tissierella creatinophila]|uniref:Sortase family protein n=1 Tax=Tissierella creatinophila DSM 6911 TaxID=1123403 RepID=A0A1U7M4Y8_TISCR|nr:class B sortase [Tissierella creatinophila]OLS02320.1 sortase family protein [Tissierella creatinophila DSM 6911]
MKIIKRLAILVSVVVLLVSSYRIVSYGYKSVNNKNLYKDISSIYTSRATTSDGLNSLKEINKDIVAWIEIPNTNIDYPVVQGKDNSFYLTHDIKGKKSPHGSIFMDYRNLVGEDKSLVIYGHHMKDGTMFKDLVKYKDKDFFDKNKEIFVIIDGKKIEYEIVSVLLTKGDSEYIDIDFESSNEFLDYIERIKKDSLFYREIPFDGDEKLLTLSTCSYEFDNARTAIYAIKK